MPLPFLLDNFVVKKLEQIFPELLVSSQDHFINTELQKSLLGYSFQLSILKLPQSQDFKNVLLILGQRFVDVAK